VLGQAMMLVHPVLETLPEVILLLHPEQYLPKDPLAILQAIGFVRNFVAIKKVTCVFYYLQNKLVANVF
jgi:hypothetical protein